MNFEEGIRYILANNSAVKAVVGARIYPASLPQGATYPALTYQIITEDDQNTVADVGDLKWSRVQVDSWAGTYAAAKSLADLVNAALNVKKSVLVGVTIVSSSMVGGRYFFEEAVKAHRRSRDYGCWYNKNEVTE